MFHPIVLKFGSEVYIHTRNIYCNAYYFHCKLYSMKGMIWLVFSINLKLLQITQFERVILQNRKHMTI
jgi:hypothetical protein